MGEKTKIAWCERTYNPWQGCTKVSPGCVNCYMFREKIHYNQDPKVVIRSQPATFRSPLKWERELAARNARARVFVCSWSDYFHVLADAWRPEVWKIIRQCLHQDFLLCTKRPERILECLPPDWGDGWRNVWIGATVENADYLSRLDILRKVPAVVRFASFEPLLGPLPDLHKYLAGIHWGIFGAESGPHHTTARPMEIPWLRDGIRECRLAGTWPFVKQVGLGNGTISADPGQWAEDLRVRESPPSAPILPLIEF